MNQQNVTTSGERLKYLRALIRVSRTYLQNKYDLPEVTLKSWENGTTKLSQMGAARCVEMYREEGLIVSADWILDGTGLDPKQSVAISHYFAQPTDKILSTEEDEVLMLRDANRFKESHADAVVMVVSNDDMLPFYHPGDYVAGKMRYGDAVETVINKDCIVYLKNGSRFFRRVIKNSIGGYNLTCLNPYGETAEPVLYNVVIESVAPVIWYRRKDD